MHTVYIQLIFRNFKAGLERQFRVALVANTLTVTGILLRPPSFDAGQRFAQRQSWHTEACHHVPVARFVDPWLLHPPSVFFCFSSSARRAQRPNRTRSRGPQHGA